ncbi:membrane protein [Streptomyces marokkonensis]|uniref:Membrane protein n=1 Tax=Streptomyces marokkonensis TaxID=324855 RepID=A0ABP7QWD0_9ACTN
MNTERPDNDDATAADEAGTGRPARRRPPAVVVASVAAAVLLVGSGGAYLASSASGGGADGGTASGASGDDTPPPLVLDGHGAPTPGGQDGTNGIAPGEPDPYGVTYRADGTLPDGPGSAPVYRAKGKVTEAEVARLAKALGVDGAPREQGEAWKVGNAKDGSGPLLTVNRQAPGTWTFHRYAPGTDNCEKGAVCKAPSADGSPVSEAAAKKAAAPVLKALGQDDAKLDAGQVMGARRAVNAEPEVGGLPTYGWTTGVVVGAQGDVVGGSGRVKAPVKGDTYPVLGAEETLALLNAPGGGFGSGIGGCASPVPHQDGADLSCALPTGAPKKPQKQTVTVEDAVFGLAAHPVRGRQTLVPSWLFEVRAPGSKDAVTVTYPAVDPRYLTSSAPASPSPSPSDEPSSAPTDPRDVQVSGYTAEGGELTVRFTGGVCSDYEATAQESGEKVTVTVTETPHPDKVCILIAKEYERTVPLDEPLGDRTVVSSDGEEIPVHKPGARLPAPSGNR